MSPTAKININGSLTLGKGESLVFILGPCVIESRDHTLRTAEKLKDICEKQNISLVYKSSFDKANRTSASSFRGPGLDQGLRILEEVKNNFALPVISDIHEASQAIAAAEVLDLIQIPAFLCRQTDLIEAAAKTKKPLLIKKAQFLHPDDMAYVVEKARACDNQNIALCERGSTFGYRELVVDFRSLKLMRELNCPVVFDATHSVQVVGGAGGTSSGNREFVPMLARAAVAAGIDGLFLECHENPSSAPSDGPNMLEIDSLSTLISDLLKIQKLELATR